MMCVIYCLFAIITDRQIHNGDDDMAGFTVVIASAVFLASIFFLERDYWETLNVLLCGDWKLVGKVYDFNRARQSYE